LHTDQSPFYGLNVEVPSAPDNPLIVDWHCLKGRSPDVEVPSAPFAAVPRVATVSLNSKPDPPTNSAETSFDGLNVEVPSAPDNPLIIESPCLEVDPSDLEVLPDPPTNSDEASFNGFNVEVPSAPGDPSIVESPCLEVDPPDLEVPPDPPTNSDEASFDRFNVEVPSAPEDLLIVESPCLEVDPSDLDGPGTPEDSSTPFVFEEPKPSYFLLDYTEKEKLLAMGPLAIKRLVYIERIHVVIQSVSKTQVSVARRLDLPHYQATMSQIQALVFPSIIFYQDKFVVNDFLYVTSEHSTEINQLFSTINFQHIGSRLLSRKPSNSMRQSYYQDFGFSSSQSTSRKDALLGISKPSTKPGTTDKPIQRLLTTCSNVLAAMDLRIFAFEKERLLCFAGSLAESNQIEAMRLAITDESNLCGIHEDRKNDCSFASVPVFSRYIQLKGKRYRVSIIMYSRKSIADYLKRKNQSYGPAVSFVLDAFSTIQEARRSIIPEFFPKTDSDSDDCHGLAFSRVPCHMDPSFYVSPVIHFGLMLSFRHSLHFGELVSVFRAWASMPFTSYYFVSGCIVLLQQKELPLRGLLIGHSLLNIMKGLREDHQGLKKKIPGLRFPIYRKVVVPEEKR